MKCLLKAPIFIQVCQLLLFLIVAYQFSCVPARWASVCRGPIYKDGSRSARENFSIKNLNLIAALETSVGRAIMEDGTSINEV